MITLPVPGRVVDRETPQVERAPLVMLYKDVMLLTATVWPGAIQVLGMPRPM
ncbi:hypothetical protein [Kibdelosporangium aridum]|uniref:hypothetical protein n=1 Tax=Kibdelosporangium aridum TaxID=2030 RepID=UPI00163BF8F4|nr:hypothetical protein [Kibdelosporangium aridum]